MYNNKSKQNQFKSSSNKSVAVKPKQPVITDMNAFPELSSKNAPSIINSSADPTSFANKVKWVEEEKNEEKETWYGVLGTWIAAYLLSNVG